MHPIRIECILSGLSASLPDRVQCKKDTRYLGELKGAIRTILEWVMIDRLGDGTDGSDLDQASPGNGGKHPLI